MLVTPERAKSAEKIFSDCIDYINRENRPRTLDEFRTMMRLVSRKLYGTVDTPVEEVMFDSFHVVDRIIAHANTAAHPKLEIVEKSA